MLVGTTNKIADFFAQLFLAARWRLWRARSRYRTRLSRKLDLGFAEVVHFPQLSCIQDNLGGELERFEALESLAKRITANYHAMVFEKDTIGFRLRTTLFCYAHTQFLAPWERVWSKGDLPADVPCLWKKARVWYLTADAEADQRPGMSMDDSLKIRPRFIKA